MVLKLFHIPSFGIIPFALCLFKDSESMIFDESKCVGLFPQASYALDFSVLEFKQLPINYKEFVDA